MAAADPVIEPIVIMDFFQNQALKLITAGAVPRIAVALLVVGLLWAGYFWATAPLKGF